MTLCPRILELMKKEKLDDVLVIVGGIIPATEIVRLKELGVSEVFQPGATTQAIADFIRTKVRKHKLTNAG